MGCGATLVKYVLFLTNLFFALAGLTLLGLGVAVQLQMSAIVNLVDSSFEAAPIASMVVGGIIFLIAFFGCCGAIRESNCMLVLYGIFMIILIVIKVAMATLIFMNLNTADQVISKWLTEAFQQENKIPFHELETSLKCCGTQGPISYGSLTLPASCCVADATVCTPVNAYQTGCVTKVSDFVQTFGTAIGAVTIVIIFVEIVAVVFALCLANHARNKDRRSRY